MVLQEEPAQDGPVPVAGTTRLPKRGKASEGKCMRVQCARPTGQPGTEFMGIADIDSLSPATFVTNGVVAVPVWQAAKVMMARTGCDARVISGSKFVQWMKCLKWSDKDWKAAEKDCKKGDIKASMAGVHLEKADFVFIGFVRDLHWSLLILCHPGAWSHDAGQQMQSCRTLAALKAQVHAGRLLTETTDQTKPAILLHLDSTKKHRVDRHMSVICRTLALLMPLQGAEIEDRLHLYSVCNSGSPPYDNVMSCTPAGHAGTFLHRCHPAVHREPYDPPVQQQGWLGATDATPQQWWLTNCADSL